MGRPTKQYGFTIDDVNKMIADDREALKSVQDCTQLYLDITSYLFKRLKAMYSSALDTNEYESMVHDEYIDYMFRYIPKNPKILGKKGAFDNIEKFINVLKGFIFKRCKNKVDAKNKKNKTVVLYDDEVNYGNDCNETISRKKNADVWRKILEKFSDSPLLSKKLKEKLQLYLELSKKLQETFKLYPEIKNYNYIMVKDFLLDKKHSKKMLKAAQDIYCINIHTWNSNKRRVREKLKGFIEKEKCKKISKEYHDDLRSFEPT